jgi:hypothetical protein
MASHFGVTTPAIAAPSGGHVHEESISDKCEIVTTPNSLGVTVFADFRGHKKADVSVKGVGSPNFALVVAGDIVAGTLKIMTAKLTNELGKRKMFEYTGLKYTNGVYA